LTFEWNRQKALANHSKHAVTFEEAATIFGDSLSKTIFDPLHSTDEGRFITIGRSAARRILLVVHTDREERIRLLSARPVTRRERKEYEKNSTPED
jgi:uncharacterized DUF497 family protein